MPASSAPSTAFAGTRQLAAGALIDVAVAIRDAGAAGSRDPILVFDDRSGALIDLDLRGTAAEIAARLRRQDEIVPSKGPGRPRLGVIAREITLLPRHWHWLAAQPGGASRAVRRLVDQARRADGGETAAVQARERCYRFLSALAGDLPGFEEASRALFGGDTRAFADRVHAWPQDVRRYALHLLEPTPEAEP